MEIWQSEKQLQTKKDALIKEFSKTYYVFVMPFLLDYELSDLQAATDNEYKAICKEDGRIYTLEDFEKSFNDDEINSVFDYLRILKD